MVWVRCTELRRSVVLLWDRAVTAVAAVVRCVCFCAQAYGLSESDSSQLPSAVAPSKSSMSKSHGLPSTHAAPAAHATRTTQAQQSTSTTLPAVSLSSVRNALTFFSIFRFASALFWTNYTSKHTEGDEFNEMGRAGVGLLTRERNNERWSLVQCVVWLRTAVVTLWLCMLLFVIMLLSVVVPRRCRPLARRCLTSV